MPKANIMESPALAIPHGVIEASELARQAYTAIKVLNKLLAHAEPGTTLEANDMAALTMMIESGLYSAIDELNPLVHRSGR